MAGTDHPPSAPRAAHVHGPHPVARRTAFAGSAPARALPAVVFALLVAAAVVAVEWRDEGAAHPLALRIDATAPVSWSVTLDGRELEPEDSDDRRWEISLPGGALGTLLVHAHLLTQGDSVALRLRAEAGGASAERLVWGDHAEASLAELAPVRAHGDGCLHAHAPATPAGSATGHGGHDHDAHHGHDHD